MCPLNSGCTPLRIHVIAGARASFAKVAPILRAMAKRDDLFAPMLIHTAQDCGREMSEVFCRELGISSPDFHLGVGSGTYAQQCARIMCTYEDICRREAAQLVIVVGDMNATVACSIVAKKVGMDVAHVEAGLRSGDWNTPEEVNRVMTDSVADLCFTTEPNAVANLRREGKAPEQIYQVGHVIVDNLLHLLEELECLGSPPVKSSIVKQAHRCYAVLTLNRPANTDDPNALREITEAIRRVSERIPVIFPIHPRVRQRVEELNLDFGSRTEMTPPMSFIDFVDLWKDAKCVLTDSGGLQEETTALGIPCLTLRDVTERPITLSEGTNRLVGRSCTAIVSAVDDILDGNCRLGRRPPLWDGLASERIVEALAGRYFSGRSSNSAIASLSGARSGIRR
ncbi:MAG: UDP-N-acetylglucosamine 2-epimerase (non-hydrolyzing) [Burkholderiales bacterium]